MREVTGKHVVVAGMGKSGLSAVELLVSKGARVTAADTRTLDGLGEAGARLRSLGVLLAEQSAETFADADLIVLSPGVPTDLEALAEARAKQVPVIGEVELASFYLQGRNIGITGSNGKTTTTALTGHLLRETGIDCQVGGNIGTAPTAMIDSSAPDRWNVLELSSFQLETIEEFHCDVAVCVNVTPDHLDRHHTLEQYAAAKARLFDTQRPDSAAVLNADNLITESFAKHAKGAVYWFSLHKPVEQGAFLSGDTIICDGVPMLGIQDVPLRGMHNVENVMAAILAAKLAGAPVAGLAQAIQSFPGVEHRLELVRETHGVGYYNDSKATNVDATQKAIDAFRGGLWIILGGKDKDSDYTVLRASLEQKAKGILLIGAAAGKIESQLHGLPLIACGTLETAVAKASGMAKEGDTVLLAPACASFDQFENYEHRGRVFKQLVKDLP